MAADAHRLITPALLEWSVYSAQAKCTLTSHAWSHEGKVVLIDPVATGASATSALQQLGSPVLIIATNANHDRDILQWKQRLQIPVAASAHAVKGLGFKPEVILESCPVIHGLKPLALEGGALGEHALYSAEQKLLIVGDALVHLPETGLAPLPDKYCTDPTRLHRSLAALAELDFETLAFAHGEAIVSSARARVQAALTQR